MMSQIATPTNALPSRKAIALTAGVDLGAQSAKIVLASCSNGRREVHAAVRLAYPHAQSAELGDRMDCLTQYLQAWCGVTLRDVRCSLPPTKTEYETAELPPGSDVPLAGTQAMQQILGDCSNITWDAWRSSGQAFGADHDTLHLVWAANQDIHQVLDALAKANLRCGSISTAPSTLAAVGTASQSPQLILDLGHQAAEIVVAQAGEAIYLRRRLAIGTGRLTDQIADAMQVHRVTAETLLAEWGHARDSSHIAQQVSSLKHDWLSKIEFEVQRTLSYLDHRLRRSSLSQIVLCGGGALAAGLAERLTATLGVPAQTAELPGDVRWSADQPYQPNFAQALALTLPEEA